MKTELMREAIKLAAQSVTDNNGGPFGALIVKENQIIAIGFNQVTSTLDPTAHGEVVAIRKACQALKTFSLEGCDLYTSCEPCPMCLSASYWARLDNIYFAATQCDAKNAGFDDSFIYEEFTKPVEARLIPMQACQPTNYLEPFELWNAKQDKIPY